jgi:hypothetical protein
MPRRRSGQGKGPPQPAARPGPGGPAPALPNPGRGSAPGPTAAGCQNRCMRHTLESVAAALAALTGGFTGLVAWAARAEERARAGAGRGPDWNVLHTELPLTVLAGAVCALGAWLLPRFGGLRLSLAGGAVRGVFLVAALAAFWLLAADWYEDLPVPVPDNKP